MLETVLKELAEGKGPDLLMSAGENLAKKLSSAKTWKDIFVDTGEFFCAHENYAGQMFDDMALVLSKENMAELAKCLQNDDGYTIKNRLLNQLLRLMEQYEIPHDIAAFYANSILYTILEQLREVAPEKYEHHFQKEWREEQNALLQTISKKIDTVTTELEKYRAREAEIYSADELDIRLKAETIHPKIGISFFKIDDEEFKKAFAAHKYDACVHVKGRCPEETLYCILNELWASQDTRAIFIAETYEDWKKLRGVAAVGNIYIPRFYRDEIAAIEGNTNIFIYSEDIPVFAHEVLTLRPRMYRTIAQALMQAGLEASDANKLVQETHGLYIPLKKKIFHGAYLKQPRWLSEIPERLRKTCLLLGQWTEADGDKVLVESLSGVSYEKFIDILLPFMTGEDPFVYKIHRSGEDMYCLASVELSWDCMRISLDEALWGQFTELLLEVLMESEALLVYSIQEKLQAHIRGEKLFWSEVIRKGMLRTLIMKGIYQKGEACQYALDLLVENILNHVQSAQQWKYIATFFGDLCEISPEVILRRLEAEWTNNTGLMDLFACPPSDTFWSKNEYSQILSGVEQFLTQKAYAPRALRWCVRLDGCAFPFQQEFSSPKGTLQKVYCAWYDFSAFDTVEQKRQAAEISLELNANTWEYIYDALPKNRPRAMSDLQAPRYREHADKKSVAIEQRKATAIAYMQILLAHMDFSVERWKKMLRIAFKVEREFQQKIFEQCVYECSQMTDAEIMEIQNSIRELIYRHRYFASAEWAMAEDKIMRYEELLGEIHTTVPEYEYVYLFRAGINFPLLQPVPYTEEGKYDINEQKKEQLVRDKLQEFADNHYSFEVLAKICSEYRPNTLGSALLKYCSGGRFDSSIFEMLLRNQHSGDMALDYLRGMREFHRDIFEQCLVLAKKYEVSEGFIVQLYQIETYTTSHVPLVAEADEDIKLRFWESITYHSTEHGEWAIAECRKYGTMQEYLKLLYWMQEKKKLSAEQIYTNLQGIETMRRGDDNQMLDFYLEALLLPIQEAFIDDKKRCMEIARLEIIFMNVLEWYRMKCFQTVIKKSPEMFAQLISILFKHEGEEPKVYSEEERGYWKNIYTLYDVAEFCPTEENGEVELEKLQRWLEGFKDLLAQNGQLQYYGQLVGRLLAFGPMGKDGHEPCEAVRQFIERDADESFIQRYQMTMRNKRAAHTADAGKSELELARAYRENADFLSMRYTKTADIYYSLARDYEAEAKEERERAENGWF